jgi:hypothetical protein
MNAIRAFALELKNVSLCFQRNAIVWMNLVAVRIAVIGELLKLPHSMMQYELLERNPSSG